MRSSTSRSASSMVVGLREHRGDQRRLAGPSRGPGSSQRSSLDSSPSIVAHSGLCSWMPVQNRSARSSTDADVGHRLFSRVARSERRSSAWRAAVVQAGYPLVDRRTGRCGPARVSRRGRAAPPAARSPGSRPSNGSRSPRPASSRLSIRARWSDLRICQLSSSRRARRRGERASLRRTSSVRSGGMTRKRYSGRPWWGCGRRGGGRPRRAWRSTRPPTGRWPCRAGTRRSRPPPARRWVRGGRAAGTPAARPPTAGPRAAGPCSVGAARGARSRSRRPRRCPNSAIWPTSVPCSSKRPWSVSSVRQRRVRRWRRVAR